MNLQYEMYVLRQYLDRRFKMLEAALRNNRLRGFVSTIYGRNQTMANVAVPKLLDVEKIVLSVMPRKADGSVDVDAQVSWSSSDPSQVGIELNTESFVFVDPQSGVEYDCPGAFNATATTPLASGSASVTATAVGYTPEYFGPIEYAAGVARSLNGSVGSPISDL